MGKDKVYIIVWSGKLGKIKDEIFSEMMPRVDCYKDRNRYEKRRKELENWASLGYLNEIMSFEEVEVD